ncbi:glycosyltransferase family 87 protein [Ralstonia sp. UBA689]|uniref:glycosyltransferase family 87 protein n=1 Tax=Ralstonia sp. UBA689 TaxID=1947373 RepID=UPI0025F845BB|nr:glycosyltransferase family 87 protein [Ralstonia sp. UBA689]
MAAAEITRDPLRVAAGHWLDRERVRVYSIVALVCYAAYFGIWCVRADVLKVDGVFPLGGDFVVFWSAAQLTLQGTPLGVYDFATLHALEVATVPLIATNHAILPWFYPPTFLLFVLPFGLLPYWLAVPVFFGVSAGAFLSVVRRIVPWREAWLPCVAFPGIAVVLATGQNALLLAACAGLALTKLQSRPVVAGMLLALLTLKPQLALMVPVALVCARAWKTLAAMALTTLGLTAVALGAFGVQSFTAFLHNAGFARSVVESGAVILARMPTVFALVKMLHGGVVPAYVLHLAVAVVAAGVVVYAWRRPCAFALQASALIVATLLASAYLYDYDLAFLGLAIAWFGTYAWRQGWLPGERELLVLLWLLPLAGMLLIESIGFQLMPIILLLALAQIARRIHLERASNT